ncbi:hypothetical protein RJ639_015171 [Escallonia herrerae]|uniref:Disease resistance protein RPM1 n=1 Tax=Escallonia herrerae TaxID=1293975 RepID=A0AA89ANZ9_9ASTE|nr:hypothetical protein RJ639_015171 [Escallonia herrerae]
MAEIAIAAAIPLVEEAILYFNNHKLNRENDLRTEVPNLRTWLKGMQAFLRDQESKETTESLKHKVEQARDVAYDIEDVLDDFMLHAFHQHHRHDIFNTLHDLAHYVKHWSSFSDLSSKIQKIKEKINNLKDFATIAPDANTNPSESGESSSPGLGTAHQVMRLLDHNDIVGFERIREDVIHQLIHGGLELMTISLVGRGGSGKTILAKNVYDSTDVRGKFDCHAWVHAACDLFHKRAFQSRDRECPPELRSVSEKIVEKCEGSPLAIATVGALLSMKPMDLIQWNKFHDSLGTVIGDDANLVIISRILRQSYRELSSNHRSCFLYFTMFPEDCSIERGRLIRMWVAERFVACPRGEKTSEEVAEEYLDELIGRNLVRASRRDLDGRIRSCRVQSVTLEFIIQKSEEDQSTVSADNIRRLSVRKAGTALSQVTGDRAEKVRSAFFSGWYKPCSRKIGEIVDNFKLLRVLDLQDAPLDEFPEYVVSLTLLRYLSLRNATKIKEVPKSIKKLLCLETLDLRQTGVTKLPEQILHLHNLRHLLAYRYDVKNYVDFDSVQGVEIFAGIEYLTNLQNLSLVKYKPDKHCKILNELGKLTQLRKLGLFHLKSADGKHLCTSIEKMKNLRTLDVRSTREEEYLNMESMLHPPPNLQRLYLKGRLHKIPEWVCPSLNHLSKIGLKWSKLEASPLDCLQHLPELVELELVDAYTGVKLVFAVGSFKKLKKLHVEKLDQLHTVVIQEGAVPDLQKLVLCNCVELKMLPLGINNLSRVEELLLYEMPKEFIAQLHKSSKDRVMVSHIPIIRSFTLDAYKRSLDSIPSESLHKSSPPAGYRHEGVNSVMIEGEDKDKVVVIGDGIDAACLTRSLRKKVGHATLVSVEVLKPKDPVEKEDKKPGKDKPVTIQWTSGYCCQYQYPQLYLCKPVSDPEPPPCSIM